MPLLLNDVPDHVDTAELTLTHKFDFLEILRPKFIMIKRGLLEDFVGLLKSLVAFPMCKLDSGESGGSFLEVD